MMTRKAFLTLTSALLLALAGLAVGSIPLVLLAAALALFPVATLAVTRFPEIGGSRRLAVDRLFEGDTCEVELTVQNTGASPAVVEVAEELSPLLRIEAPETVHTLSIPGNAMTMRDYGLVAPIRGHYSVPPARYRVTDLFDTYAREGRLATQQYVSVFPKRNLLRDMPVRSRYPMGLIGEHGVSQPGQGVEFFGLREYLPGDPMRAVNWKASARLTDTLVVNQREKETAAEVTLLLDARAITERGTVGDNPLLHCCRAAATVASLYLGRKDKLRLITYGEGTREVAYDTGERQLYKVLEALAAAKAGGNAPVGQVVDGLLASLRPKSPVILVSSLEGDPSSVEAATLLRSLNVQFVVVSPGMLRPLAVASETERAEVLAEREATLQQLRAFGARVIDVEPDTNLQDALMVVGRA
ncbi:MAG TPA: DUF58 domain-containing protein [Candidatus Thermoplasmatota archaeon]|nr:DUF58 domain-containing protein [Candidatus Thermoplasmatota archaeon]